jgi:hypothetical protein
MALSSIAKATRSATSKATGLLIVQVKSGGWLTEPSSLTPRPWRSWGISRTLAKSILPRTNRLPATTTRQTAYSSSVRCGRFLEENDHPGRGPAAPIGPRCRAPLNLSAAGATNNGSLDRGRPGKAVGLGGIMHQSRPLAAASAALVCGSIASASGVVVQIAGHEGDGKSVIAAVSQSSSTIAAMLPSPSTIAALLPSPGTTATIPPGPSTVATVPPGPSATPAAVVSPPPPAKSAPAVSAPVKRQDSASQSNSPQTTRLDAFAPAVTASTTAATTDLTEQPAPAPKKSQKAGHSANERNRGRNDAGWGRYAHERPTSSW